MQFQKGTDFRVCFEDALQSVTCTNMQFVLAIETRLVHRLNKKITIEIMVSDAQWPG